VIDLDDYDFDTDSDFGAKKSPSAKSPYFTQPTQIIPRSSPPAHETQPTQIVSPRNTLKKPTLQDLIASSPRSVIEVPASPDVRRPPKFPIANGKLAQSMAPPGTAYRAPNRPAPVAQTKKRNHLDISDDDLTRPIFDDDSSEEDTPMRGEIVPSRFAPKKPTVSEPLAKKQATSHPKQPDVKYNEARLVQLSLKLHREVKAKSEVRTKLEDCRRSLLKNGLVYGDALKDLLYGPPSSQLASPAQQRAKENKVIDLSSPEPEPTQDSDFDQTPKPAPRRGRLIQGRRNGPVAHNPSPASPDPLSAPKQVIDLVSSDRNDSDEEQEAQYTEDENAADEEADPADARKRDAQEAREGRALEYLNTCSKVDLMAMAKITDAKATAMLKHKPFETIGDARRVRTINKTKRKSTKDELGHDVVDAIVQYIEYLEAVDEIVGQCEKRTMEIRSATSTWNLDIYGQSRTRASVPADSDPLTPSSTDEEKLVPLPITREPALMRDHCSLKSYQLYGLNWLHMMYRKRIGGILADDMGLGKTCQVISLLSQIVGEYQSSSKKANSEQPWPHLVVVPASTLGNWEAEFEKFAPDLKVTVYNGSQAERDELALEMREDPYEHEVILTSYSQVGRSEDSINLNRLQPKSVIFDEGHTLKNPTTKLFKRLFSINANDPWKLMLTGTPVQNNLMELIGLLRMLEPKTFHRQAAALEDFFSQKVTLKDVSNGALLFSDRVNRASSILAPFILQRKKEQVLELPPKTHRTVYCELHELQRPIYRAFENKFAKAKTLGKVTADDSGNPENNPWIQTRKAALHPYLFRRFFTDAKVEKMMPILWKKFPASEKRPERPDLLLEELKGYNDFQLHLWCRDVPALAKFDIDEKSLLSSGKIEKLLELVREYKDNGDRVLIFTRFEMTVPILLEVFDLEGINNRQFTGTTPVEERQDLIDEFNNDPSITAFIITTGSGATGINLTAANKVIIFDPSDNPQLDIQAENRAHRIGQTQPVEVIRLVTKGTIEELILAAGERKIELAKKVTGQDEEGAFVAMTELEMKKTVRQGLLERGAGLATPDDE
jgi:SWI/SNF-related matrix-associated actin-dependent regulator 1 of chromatin subfamily A